MKYGLFFFPGVGGECTSHGLSSIVLQLRYFNAIYVLQEAWCGASITTHSMNEPTGDEPQYEDSTL